MRLESENKAVSVVLWGVSSLTSVTLASGGSACIAYQSYIVWPYHEQRVEKPLA
jgi:hypothetical protein